MTANLPTDVAADSVATGLTEPSLTFSHERSLAGQSGFVNRSLGSVGYGHGAAEQCRDDSDPTGCLNVGDETVDASEGDDGQAKAVERVTGCFGDACEKVHEGYVTTGGQLAAQI
jgi:hypothetical protein